MHAELARFVARGSHDAALGRTAYRYRLAAELRIVALLDGRVERIHVDVDDLAMRRRRDAPLRVGGGHTRIIQTFGKRVAVGSLFFDGLAFRTGVADGLENFGEGDRGLCRRDPGRRITPDDIERAVASMRVGTI